MFSTGQFKVEERQIANIGGTNEIYPFCVYRSQPMCLRDASRFAAALSYARGTYVQVAPVTPGESYEEWWFAGALMGRDGAPEVRGKLETHSVKAAQKKPDAPTSDAKVESTWFLLDVAKREHINTVLDICQGNQVRAAKLLGIGRTSLYRYLKRGEKTSQKKSAA